MNTSGNRKRWTVLYSLILITFTSYVLMDTFWIPHAYGTTEVATVSQGSSQAEQPFETIKNNTDSGIVTENSYKDDNIEITLNQYREYNSDIYVADIQVSSIEYLKTALAKGTYGKNIKEKTSEIAKENNAIFAINGDFYGAHEKGYVIRNGVLYRETASSSDQEDLVIEKDGRFKVIEEGGTTAEALLNQGVLQVLNFGPALMVDNEVTVTEKDEVDRAKTSNPRTAIGVVEPLHYIVVVANGRTTESKGLTLYELANFMKTRGVTTAYNLDGGGSSTMYFNGELINQPTTNGKSIQERSVSDIVYIGY